VILILQKPETQTSSPLKEVVQEEMDLHQKIKEDTMGLVLSRRVGEKVVLETNQGPITVTITDLSPSRVKLSFDCSRDILILRSEIIERNTQSDG
jgi:carbon storage regulator CsrA